MDKDGILRGLAARLALDADLGLGYVSRAGTVAELLRGLSNPTPPVRAARAVPATAAVDEKPAVFPEKSEKKSDPAPVPPAPPQLRTRPATAVRSGTEVFGGVSLVPYEEPPPHPDREAALAELRNECLACEQCGLCELRQSVVWGEGNLAAGVMFIGEGPGRDEDLEGRPFVGRSGRVLTDIIEKGMGLPRSHVYITNVVKCRPPGNRDPRPGEVSACSRYLTRQIEVIRPKVLVAVGSVAGRTLLGLGEGSAGLRGRWHEYGGIPLRVIYHPSYLLRLRRHDRDRTTADRTTWMDIKEVMTKIEGGTS